MHPVAVCAAAHIVAGRYRLTAANAGEAGRPGRVIGHGQPRLADEVGVFQVQANGVRGCHREPEAAGTVVVQVCLPDPLADPHP